LFGVIAIAFGTPPGEVIQWLQDENLWSELTPAELAYVSTHSPSEKQQIQATWESEALIVLLWAVGRVEKLPQANEQCDTALFQELLPPFADMSVTEFIASAKRRSEDDLLNMAEELLELHWQARDADLNSKPVPTHVDIEIIQERHKAIYLIIGYEGLPWDEVTTDT
jgi:hypothetical protein